MFSDDKLIKELQSFTGEDRARNLFMPDSDTGTKSFLASTANAPDKRDMALWGLAYQNKRNATGIILEVAADEENPKLRKSAAWALMKLGHAGVLKDILDLEKDENLKNWKKFLINELQDNSQPFDKRPVRVFEDRPYDFVMPLEVEGFVEFRDIKGNWHTIPTGPMTNERMIGTLTPAINADSFHNTLVLQKRIKNVNNSGADHIEGYYLKGLSRQIGDNVFRHQYEALSKHDVYPSGIVGDESMGKIEAAGASIARQADTHITVRDDVPFPYPHSVRGSFRGFVFMNPDILKNPSMPIDGLLQIITPVDEKAGNLVNGIFYGTFRGIPEDINNDGKVELNGIEVLIDKLGNVLDKKPKSGK